VTRGQGARAADASFFDRTFSSLAIQTSTTTGDGPTGLPKVRGHGIAETRPATEVMLDRDDQLLANEAGSVVEVQAGSGRR